MKRILVVDDEFDLTSTLKAVLEWHGYAADVCSNGREALECVREARPDLVLLDVMIPLGSGYEVVEKLRRTEEFKDVPVVLMNSVPPPGDRPELWQAFLRKPLSIPPLLETVAGLIGRPEPAAEQPH